MTNTTYTGDQTAARARLYTAWPVGYCLKFVKQVTSPTVSSPYSDDLPDANHAWEHAQHRESTAVPPPGAPTYWASGIHGHIAPSLGGGYVRSTDWPVKSRVSTVLISTITRSWGMVYRGWSRDYAGLWIAGIQEAPVPATKPVDLTSPISVAQLRPLRQNTAVARFEKALWNWMGSEWRERNVALSGYYGDGYWGMVTTTTMQAAYARLGLPSDVTYPGPTLVRALGFKDVDA